MPSWLFLTSSKPTTQDGKENVREFKHITSEIGAYEAEEVRPSCTAMHIHNFTSSVPHAQHRKRIADV